MMSPASPAANSPEAGTEQTWFKIYEQSPTYENGELVFPSTSEFISYTIKQKATYEGMQQPSNSSRSQSRRACRAANTSCVLSRYEDKYLKSQNSSFNGRHRLPCT